MMLIEILKNLPLIAIVCIFIFIVFAILELVFAFTKMEKLRRIVKPFLLVDLAVCEIVLFPHHPFLYIAALLAAVGDVLVVYKDKKAFYVGGFLFYFGHIAYIIEIILYLLKGANIKYTFYIMLAVYFVVLAFVFYFFVFKKHAKNKPESILGSIYFGGLTTLIPVFILATAKVPNFMYFGLIGAISFVVSDLIICFSRYTNKLKKPDFYIMVFYIFAQFMIFLGFVFTYTNVA